jgi:hypothetical protein
MPVALRLSAERTLLVSCREGPNTTAQALGDLGQAPRFAAITALRAPTVAACTHKYTQFELVKLPR